MSLVDYDQAWNATKSRKSTNSKATEPKPAVPTISVSDADDKTGPAGQHSPDPDSLQQDGAVPEKNDSAVGQSTNTPKANGTGETKDADGNKPVPADEDERDEDEPETIPRIMDVTEMATRTGQNIVTRTRRFRKPKAKAGKYQEYAGVHRRILDEDGFNIATKLEIKSPILREALKTILKDQQLVNLEANPITISKPYEPLFYYRKAIEQHRDGLDPDTPARAEMDTLVEFIHLNLDQLQERYDNTVPYGKVTSDMIWTLFPPGEIVVFGADSALPIQCLMVKDCRRVADQIPQLRIKCSLFEYNGRSFGKTFRSFAFLLPQLPGPMPITDLNVYPLRFHPKHEELKTNLIARGRRYTELVRRAHMDYNGVVWTKHPLDDDIIQVHVKGRVMIDYHEYIRQCPAAGIRLEGDLGGDVDEREENNDCYCGIPSCTLGRKKGDSGAAPDSKAAKVGGDDAKNTDKHGPFVPKDEEALLCPGRVRGFALTDKCWAEFRIDRLTEIKWNDTAYGRLEMEEGTKGVIKALVASHRKHSKLDAADFDDIIAGKGLGLVFLLQGPPGLGKTLTAESVAEQAKKPLYSVTSGELGTTVNDMETALAKAFRIAKEWNAILLLDEADVFLSKRTVDNLEKNAFVSVFLRLMEYYQGILFLTTNRADDFDPAFLSRIHLIIDYEKLTPERRAKIWHNLSSNMEKDGTMDEAGLKLLGEQLDINGREIKNLLRTAWCLAKEEQRPLSMVDVKTVVKVGNRPGLVMS